MRAISLFFLFFTIHSISLYSETSHYLGTYLGSLHTSKEKIEKENISITENYQNNNLLFFYSPQLIQNKSDEKNSNIFYNLNPTLKIKEDESKKVSFYSGDNLYVGYKLSKFNLILGKKPFSNSFRSDQSWKDGTEGLTLETEFKNGSNLKIFVFDYYRGFIQFKNEFFIERDITYKGNRFRSGFEYDLPLNHIFLNFHSSYVNLGNWGRYSNDDPKRIPEGDNDFLYFNSFSLNFKKSNFRASFSMLSSKGIDRYPYNPITKTKNLLTTGEAIQIFTSYEGKNFIISSTLFLPDSNKINSQNEILESGYIGMGSYYAEGFLLSQFINYLPANWITQNGLERSSTIYNSRQNSFFGKLKFSFFWDNIKISVLHEKYIPYKNQISLNGEIYIDKKYFSPNGISETSLTFEFRENKESTLFCKVQISKLISEFSDKTQASSFYIAGGLKF
jgi:hypothetical protein